MNAFGVLPAAETLVFEFGNAQTAERFYFMVDASAGATISHRVVEVTIKGYNDHEQKVRELAKSLGGRCES